MKAKHIVQGVIILSAAIGVGLTIRHFQRSNHSPSPTPKTPPRPASNPTRPENKRRPVDPLQNMVAPPAKCRNSCNGHTISPAMPDSPAQSPTRKFPPPKADEFPLRPGSRGKRVERLQVWLMRNFGRTRVVNGQFDKHTLNQVRKRLGRSTIPKALFYELKMHRPVYYQHPDV